ncbi:GM19525 [Drosophila sechellia]|uniref:GM19525 n=1 Tax=Drosophila sechellia TaxID=7238 RepID=B4IIK8_DROSE|nr:GM19525 [Drosophila sechellia]
MEKCKPEERSRPKEKRRPKEQQRTWPPQEQPREQSQEQRRFHCSSWRSPGYWWRSQLEREQLPRQQEQFHARVLEYDISSLESIVLRPVCKLLVHSTAPVVTATSSQVIARNYKGITAAPAIAPVGAPLAAPVVAKYAAAPLAAPVVAKYAAAPLAAPLAYSSPLAYSAPLSYAAAPAPFLI